MASKKHGFERLSLETLEDRRLLSTTPIISEFLTKNDGGFRDGDGQASDWVEIFNPTDAVVQLQGYHLSDDAADKAKWTFPVLELAPNGYLVVFASGQAEPDYVDPSGFLHTTFALQREGEYLGLIDPNGVAVSEFGSVQNQYPLQRTNISYGVAQPIDFENPTIGFFAQPTPGEPNPTAQETFQGFVADTNFSEHRGYFEEPFQLEITTETPNAVIRFTTDGSQPTAEHGEIYSAPTSIDTTTTLRAAAFRDDLLSTNVDTQTYVFLDDVLLQNGAGLPETWGTFPFGSTEAAIGTPVPANYDVDPEVVNDPRYQNAIKDDLKSLPTLSLVMNPSGLWDEETGIYANTLEKGIEWERPVSVELFNPDGTTEFQIDAGVRMHGGFGRRPAATAKHSFRLFFKGEYGASKLVYPWFGEDQVSQFDTIVLRANYNYSWARGDRGGEQTGKDYTLVTDRWAAEAQREMGGLPTNGTFVHLYVNGLYWGVYNPNERPDASFLAEHLGGNKSDYDVIAHDGLVDGSLDAWNELNALARTRDYDAIKQVVDMDNYIDYLILNQFGGNLDWPGNNWYASKKREDGAKWQFHSWDAEFFFIDVNHNVVSGLAGQGPGTIFSRLRSDPEFQIDFADRIYKHLFNDGVLTAARNSERLTKLAESIDRAVVGESARWGDAWMNQVDPARTRDDDWIPRLDQLRDEYFQQRNEIVVEQYRRVAMFPNILPPVLNSTDGPNGLDIELKNPNDQGVIYFTTNGQDPRLPGGEINPEATEHAANFSVAANTTVRTRILFDGIWSAIAETEFSLSGDFSGNGELDAADIDRFCERLRDGVLDPSLDLNHDTNVDSADFHFLIEDIFDTSIGDANLDGIFNSSDLIKIFQSAEYEDNIELNSNWSSGDWNCDQEFSSGDLVVAFQTGAYVAASIGSLFGIETPDLWLRAETVNSINGPHLQQHKFVTTERAKVAHTLEPSSLGLLFQ